MSFHTLMREIAVLVAFLNIIVLGAYIIIHRKNPEKRARTINGLLIIGVVMFMALMASSLSSNFHESTVNLTKESMSDMSASNLHMDESDMSNMKKIEMGYIERTAIDMLNIFVNSLKSLRTYLLGEDISLSEILLEADPLPIVDMKIEINDRGSTIDLYVLVVQFAMTFASIYIYKTAFHGMKMAYDENEETIYREQMLKWFYGIILVAFIPPVLTAFGNLLNQSFIPFRAIKSAISYNEIFMMGTEYFGVVVPMAQLYIMYIEFKMWFLLITRIVFINGMYVGLPVAIVLWMISSKFKGMEVMISTLLRFLFMPVMYMLSLAVTSLVIKAIGADNVFVVIAVLSTIYTLAERFLESFHIMPNLRDSSGAITSIMAGAAMSMMMLRSSRSSVGGNAVSSGASGGGGGIMNFARSAGNKFVNSNSTMKSAYQSASNVIGQSKGLQTAGAAMKNTGSAMRTVANMTGSAMSSSFVRAGAGLAAGASLTAISGNPVLGAAGFKAASGAVGATGRGLSGLGSKPAASTGPSNQGRNPVDSGQSQTESQDTGGRGRARGAQNNTNSSARRNSQLNRSKSAASSGSSSQGRNAAYSGQNQPGSQDTGGRGRVRGLQNSSNGSPGRNSKLNRSKPVSNFNNTDLKNHSRR